MLFENNALNRNTPIDSVSIVAMEPFEYLA
jgi:hypothetical protein